MAAPSVTLWHSARLSCCQFSTLLKRLILPLNLTSSTAPSVMAITQLFLWWKCEHIPSHVRGICWELSRKAGKKNRHKEAHTLFSIILLFTRNLLFLLSEKQNVFLPPLPKYHFWITFHSQKLLLPSHANLSLLPIGALRLRSHVRRWYNTERTGSALLSNAHALFRRLASALMVPMNSIIVYCTFFPGFCVCQSWIKFHQLPPISFILL